ncbi:MAG TPA: IS256 family transposase [Glycomyces sp.]|nr:IS256 family transposase [Glycomyces sp.]
MNDNGTPSGGLDVRIAEELVEKARAEGLSLTGPDGLLAAVTKNVIQAALEAEMTEHLGFEKGDRVTAAAAGEGNHRNGTSKKTVQTGVGPVELDIPRDRAGSFEPAIVPKHTRRIGGFDEAVVSLYAKGLTTGEIQAHLAEIYGAEVSRDTISKVTDAVAAELDEWRTRPLDQVYAVIMIDCIYVKIRDGAVASRPVYVAVGIGLDGERDVLGLWVGDGGEGAKHWMSVLAELRNRGVADVLVVCCDGLKGLPESIAEIWPQATVQLCVVHLVRASLKYAAKQHWGPVSKALKRVYTAPTADAAAAEFEHFKAEWGGQYPMIARTWEAAWEQFTPFLAFPPEIRRVIYTTNMIESMNARFRQAVRCRGHFPSDQAALKVLYLVIRDRRKNRPNVVGKTGGWKRALQQFALYFGDRVTAQTER